MEKIAGYQLVTPALNEHLYLHICSIKVKSTSWALLLEDHSLTDKLFFEKDHLCITKMTGYRACVHILCVYIYLHIFFVMPKS